MKKRNLIELKLVLDQLANFGNTKFKYTVLKNTRILEPKISPLVKIEEDIKTLISEFEEDRNKLIMELGTKKDDGSVFIDRENSEIFDKFTKRLEKLIEKHKEAITLNNTKWDEYQKLLDEKLDEEIAFAEISIDSFPDDNVSAAQLETLSKFNIIQ